MGNPLQDFHKTKHTAIFVPGSKLHTAVPLLALPQARPLTNPPLKVPFLTQDEEASRRTLLQPLGLSHSCKQHLKIHNSG